MLIYTNNIPNKKKKIIIHLIINGIGQKGRVHEYNITSSVFHIKYPINTKQHLGQLPILKILWSQKGHNSSNQ